MTGPLRLLVADAQPVFRRGLRALLTAGAEQFSVVAEVASVAAAGIALSRSRPDVLIVGETLTDGPGLEVVRASRGYAPQPRAILLGTGRGGAAVFGAFEGGAAGYLLRSVGESELLDAVRTVAAGGQVLDPTLTAAMVTWLSDRRERAAAAAPTSRSLTDRQQRILSLIGQGMSNRQIGQSLGIAEKTVKNHVTEVLRRLGLTSRTEAALFVSRAATRFS